MLLNHRKIGFALAFTVCAAAAVAQTDVIANGSFESGFAGWNWAKAPQGAGGTCSYNVAVAPGVETSSGLAGFPATDGTQIVLGRVTSSSNTALIVNCALYQDVAIPLGATTGSYSLDLGVKGVTQADSAAVFIGIYESSNRVPGLGDPGIVNVTGYVVYVAPGPDATLSTHQSGSFNLAARAGTTVRFAILHTGRFVGSGVVGIDNVHFLVNRVAPSPQPVPAVSGFGLLAMPFLLCFTAYMVVRQQRA